MVQEREPSRHFSLQGVDVVAILRIEWERSSFLRGFELSKRELEKIVVSREEAWRLFVKRRGRARLEL
jgi:hypothetical protein